MLHPLLQTLFARFDHAGVVWCLLRPISAEINGNDMIQLLVGQRDIAQAQALLMEQGFIHAPGRVSMSNQSFVAYHEPTEHCVRIQVVRELALGPFGCFGTDAAADALTRRQRRASVFALAPNDAFWVLLFHCMLNRRPVQHDSRKALQQLAGSAHGDGAIARAVDQLRPGGQGAAEIIDAVRQGDWTTLQLSISMFSAAWWRQDPVGASRRLVISWIGSLATTLLNLRRSRGLSVAVLGPDGAGKSTVAEGIQATFCLPVQTVYMGLWQRRATSGRFAAVPGIRLLRLGLLVASRPFFIWSRYLAALRHQLLGRLVIFDRYIYDSLLPPRPPLAALKRPVFWVLAHLCPAPDLVFLLDAPGRLMAERKAEYDEAHLEAERQRFLSLQQRIPKLQVVDASRDLALVRRDIVRRIWEHYVQRSAARLAVAKAERQAATS